MRQPPLGLYVHIPWCTRKCPYCDFNSHSLSAAIPENDYLHALLEDAAAEAEHFPERVLRSIFIGGGTPSLFSGEVIARLLDRLAQQFQFADDIEITLEANPGSSDAARFAAYRNAGVNRISLGVQSFDDDALVKLGRVHCAADADAAIEAIKAAGFSRWNIDLMHGLPGQQESEAMHDLERALSYHPPHLSWYQLTIEPNTRFYSAPPTLPDDNELADIQAAGLHALLSGGLHQYEVSAFASSVQQQCRHNENYWKFGDYAALGAGAHGKRTRFANGKLHVERYAKQRQPASYMREPLRRVANNTLEHNDLVFEFMLNALRLNKGFSYELFEERTGVGAQTIVERVRRLQRRGLLEQDSSMVRASELGRLYLNDVVAEFLP